jgi:hypothetical protein
MLIPRSEGAEGGQLNTKISIKIAILNIITIDFPICARRADIMNIHYLGVPVTCRCSSQATSLFDREISPQLSPLFSVTMDRSGPTSRTLMYNLPER